MSIASWLVSTVTVASKTGVDSYGKPSYGSQSTFSARVQAQSKIVRNSKGEDSNSEWRVYTLTAVALTDRLWLPGADTSSQAESLIPIAITVSADRQNARQLYRVDL